ncbi:MAG: VWA domain-containing protein [Terracidiphilus sp.]
MVHLRLAGILAAVPLAIAFSTFAQQPATSAASQHPISLNIVVAPRSGNPPTDLTQQDFTVLDNKDPRPITSFRLVTPAQEPVRVIIVLDEVNPDYRQADMQRIGVDNFLRANGGKLEFPTTLALFTDSGTSLVPSFQTDGNALATALDHETLGRRDLRRGTMFGDYDRIRMSVRAVHKIAAAASTFPGRKIVFWVSPGWPLLSGPRFPLDAKFQGQVFSEVVALSTQLRQANVTLYDVNPSAVEQARETDMYEGYVKGVSKPGQVVLGNVSLPVLALQSGGTVEESGTDANPMIQKCLRDIRAWYEINFDPPPGDAPDTYHHIEVRVDKKDLKARARDGYYSNPTSNPEL